MLAVACLLLFGGVIVDVFALPSRGVFGLSFATSDKLASLGIAIYNARPRFAVVISHLAKSFCGPHAHMG